MADAAALELSAVRAGYGETVVIENVDLKLGGGESISIIGRNGVGKTTLLATVMGHTTLHGGSIKLAGAEIAQLPIFKRNQAGIAYVPQEREIFPSLTVKENLYVGARPGRWDESAVFELFPNLRERQDNGGNQLSGGEQQMLSIARALMSNPSVVLMDEPSEGLAPIIVEELSRAMALLRSDGSISIILVEQNSRVALNFSERTVVMDRGGIVYDGASAALKADHKLLDRLIGVVQAG